ncbi:MAG: alpha-hydroxy-acid oxidizing protein [Treponema sp.]|nr:alpha-hydroxy-acid oxidizing protein [Treponema sp.]
MGGVFDGKNFSLNVEGWKKIIPSIPQEKLQEAVALIVPQKIRLAPITGADENIGWPDEESFYARFYAFAAGLGIKLGVGDGCPDNKLLAGIAAVQALNKTASTPKKAAVFLKPYPQEKLLERAEWAMPVAEFIGVDIDSYNIVTMRNKVHLEKKTAAQLNELRRATKLPLVVKGVFTQESLDLIEELKPEVAYISNHGGRVETDIGSTAEFMLANIARIKKSAAAVWVDGGLRSKEDIAAALALGGEEILLGRPMISSFLESVTKGSQRIFQPRPFWL